MVVLLTVVSVPLTCKLPVITIVSPESVPMKILLSDVPPLDSSAANFVNKFAFDISSKVFPST